MIKKNGGQWFVYLMKVSEHDKLGTKKNPPKHQKNPPQITWAALLWTMSIFLLQKAGQFLLILQSAKGFITQYPLICMV